MKEKFIDLQLFADDTAGEDSTATAGDSESAATETKTEKVTAKAEKTADGEKKYSDADLDEIIGKKFAKWQAQQQKAVDEAQKLATMNATQKAEYERDQLKKELKELKEAASIAEMSKTARKMLSDDGIVIPDELLSMMVSTDAEETKSAVDGFAKLFKESVESAVKERLKGEPPKRGTGGVTTMTKEAIMAIKDPELRQKKMLENRHLFNF